MQAKGNGSTFGGWTNPDTVKKGVGAHQLYSQITWRFYDVYLGIVMVFDAENGNKGPEAGHVHCMLSWSTDGANWQWVDSKGLAGLREFIPAGPLGSFDSHVCFAAHTPLRMPDNTTRLYYMGGNGPHSGSRNSSFALATLPPDRFAGLAATTASASAPAPAPATAHSRTVTVTGATMTLTVDILGTEAGTRGAGRGAGRVVVGVAGAGAAFETAAPLTASGTDVAVVWPGATPAGLAPLIGKQVQLTLTMDNAVVYTVGFV